MTLSKTDPRLTLPDGTTIETVAYEVSHRHGYAADGEISVIDSSAITFQLGNIPSDSEYAIFLKATTSGHMTCRAGPAKFDIAAGETSVLRLTMRCGADSGTANGNVRLDIDAREATDCPEIRGLSAVPASVNVGG